MKYSYEKFAPI